MNTHFKILVINPGSTSTKIAVFEDRRAILRKAISHAPGEISRFGNIAGQKDFRKKLILKALEEAGLAPSSIDIIAARGGLTRPVAGGLYAVNKKILRDLRNTKIHGREHASSLGCLIAYDLGKEYKIPAVTMDPVATDELCDVARISGLPGIERKSLCHALNIKAVGRKAAAEAGKKKNTRFVVAHIGGGISIACLENGRIIDVNNAVLGMGPFSPQRAGSLPIADLAHLCFSGRYSKSGLLKLLAKKSGFAGYLGTDDVAEVEAGIKRGDKKAKLVYEAFVYQLAKEIGAYAAVFSGKFDAIVLTGGAARSAKLVSLLSEKISFLGRIMVFPGEMELEALAEGGLAAARKKIAPKEYK